MSVGELLIDKMSQSFKVLVIELDVIMTGPLKRRNANYYINRKKINIIVELNLKPWKHNQAKYIYLTSTQRGSTARGHFSYIASPCEKSITSSSVPCITRTGEEIFGTLSML